MGVVLSAGVRVKWLIEQAVLQIDGSCQMLFERLFSMYDMICCENSESTISQLFA